MSWLEWLLRMLGLAPAPVPPPTPVPAPIPTPLPAPIPAPPPAMGSAKPPIAGMTAMGSMPMLDDPALPPNNDLAECYVHPALYSGASVTVRWADLEPVEGQFDFSTIDTALAAISAYNAKYPNAPLRAKLGVVGGGCVPGWLLAATGSVTVANTGATKHPGVALPPTVTYGLFWTAPYRAAWQALQVALAARYDANPLVATVRITSASSRTMEPFNIGSDQANAAAYLAAGYTDAAYQAALSGAMADYAAWQQTNLDFPFNALLLLQGGMKPDASFPEALIGQFRAELGGRAVVSNHGLTSTPVNAAIPEQAVIATLSAQHAPIAFQTDGPTIDLNAAVALAVQLGATEMEMWNSLGARGQANFTAAQLAGWRSAILTND